MDAPATSARIGQPVRRKEDRRLLTGQGSFSDDINLPGQAYAVFVRSPHAHARIRAIDVCAALASPGVLGVLIWRQWMRGTMNTHIKLDHLEALLVSYPSVSRPTTAAERSGHMHKKPTNQFRRYFG